jgi:hypothetical protein
MKLEHGLHQVTRASFEAYIEGKNLTQTSGTIMHQTLYLNDKEEIVASVLTSSYGAPPEYRIKEGGIPIENQETINVVASLFKKKQ